MRKNILMIAEEQLASIWLWKHSIVEGAPTEDPKVDPNLALATIFDHLKHHEGLLSRAEEHRLVGHEDMAHILKAHQELKKFGEMLAKEPHKAHGVMKHLETYGYLKKPEAPEVLRRAEQGRAKFTAARKGDFSTPRAKAPVAPGKPQAAPKGPSGPKFAPAAEKDKSKEEEAAKLLKRIESHYKSFSERHPEKPEDPKSPGASKAEHLGRFKWDAHLSPHINASDKLHIARWVADQLKKLTPNAG